MEAYKNHCNDCGKNDFWVGYKTGLGKTQEQLDAMHKRETTCRFCGSRNVENTLDRESETGKSYGESYQIAGKLLAELIGEKLESGD